MTILLLKLHHLGIIHYCFGGLLHLNVSGALEIMDICHFQSPKFNILFYFDSFKKLQEDHLNCQKSKVYSLLMQ
jgi:hypothetical protein